MRRKQRIVIADDQRIFRDVLRRLLESRYDYQVVGEAQDGLEAVRCVEKYDPDLIIMDLNMPRRNGIDAIKEIHQRFPIIKILALTIHDSEEYIFETLKSGADGYCVKDSGQEEFLSAVRKVLSGTRYLSSQIIPKILRGNLEG